MISIDSLTVIAMPPRHVARGTRPGGALAGRGASSRPRLGAALALAWRRRPRRGRVRLAAGRDASHAAAADVATSSPLAVDADRRRPRQDGVAVRRQRDHGRSPPPPGSPPPPPGPAGDAPPAGVAEHERRPMPSRPSRGRARRPSSSRGTRSRTRTGRPRGRRRRRPARPARAASRRRRLRTSSSAWRRSYAPSSPAEIRFQKKQLRSTATARSSTRGRVVGLVEVDDPAHLVAREEQVVGLPVAVQRPPRQRRERAAAGARTARRRPPRRGPPGRGRRGSRRPPGAARASRCDRSTGAAPTAPELDDEPGLRLGRAIGEVGARRRAGAPASRPAEARGRRSERVPGVGAGVDVLAGGRLVQLVPEPGRLDQAERPRGGHAAIGQVVRQPVLPPQLLDVAAHRRLALEVDVAVGVAAAGDGEEPAPVAGEHLGVRAEHRPRLGVRDRLPVAVVDPHAPPPVSYDACADADRRPRLRRVAARAAGAGAASSTCAARWLDEEPRYRADPEAYRDGHIPGAVFVDWRHDFTDRDDRVPVQLAPPERVRRRRHPARDRRRLRRGGLRRLPQRARRPGRVGAARLRPPARARARRRPAGVGRRRASRCATATSRRRRPTRPYRARERADGAGRPRRRCAPRSTATCSVIDARAHDEYAGIESHARRARPHPGRRQRPLPRPARRRRPVPAAGRSCARRSPTPASTSPGSTGRWSPTATAASRRRWSQTRSRSPAAPPRPSTTARGTSGATAPTRRSTNRLTVRDRRHVRSHARAAE